MCYKGLESLIPTVLLSGNQLTLYCFVSVFSSSVFSASALMMASAAEKAEAKAKGAGKKKKKRKAAAPKRAKAKKAKKAKVRFYHLNKYLDRLTAVV